MQITSETGRRAIVEERAQGFVCFLVVHQPVHVVLHTKSFWSSISEVRRPPFLLLSSSSEKMIS